VNGLVFELVGPDAVPALIELTRTHYETSDLTAVEYYQWKCFAAPAGTATTVACRDLSRGGVVVGRTNGLPREVEIDGHRGVASLMTDILVHPDYRGRGIAHEMLRNLYAANRTAGVAWSYAVANPRSHRLVSAKLKTPTAGTVPLLLKPIEFRSLIERTGDVWWARVLLSMLDAGYRLSGWPNKGMTRDSAAYSAHEIVDFDASFDRFWHHVRRRRRVMVKRSSDYLQWRFGSVPCRQYRTWAVWDDGSILGYIVARVMMVRDVRCGMIADFLVCDTAGGRSAGRTLISAASNYFQHEGVAVAGCLMLPGTAEYSLLRRSGFLVCPQRLAPQPFPLILEPHQDFIENGPAMHISNWFFTMADFDVV
jgi:GNAT superfamily N-acetyltransferase